MKYDYPVFKKGSVTEDWFGRALEDPYAGLRNAKDPEVLRFVAEENAFTEEFFNSGDFAGKREKKIEHLKKVMLPELPSGLSPYKGGFIGSLTVDGVPQVHVFDGALKDMGPVPDTEETAGKHIAEAEACPLDDDIMAFLYQVPGDSKLALAVCDMKSGKLLHRADNMFSFCWSKSDGRVYYPVTEADPEAQTSSTAFYSYDPKTGEVRKVYEDGLFCIYGLVSASSDGRYILARLCNDYSTARWAAIDTMTGAAESLTGEPQEWSYVDSAEDGHCFITMSGAKKGALIAVKGGERKTLLAESEDLGLEEGFSIGGELFVTAAKDVSARLLRVKDRSFVELPSGLASLVPAGKTEDGVLLKYESFIEVPRLMSFDGKELKTVYALSGASFPGLVTEQRFAPSLGDGAMIPYYITYKKGCPLNGDNAVVMFGYGGYNAAMPPVFRERVTRLMMSEWAGKGGVYVHCNLRGGSEYGPDWHEAGMMMNKKKVFEDFIGIAEQLIRDGWTRRGRIGIVGCSNGGLLMSALITMRPDLWAVVIDSVPHTDMIHFTEDDRGPMYITEYGNPRESREMFEYLLSYSPYHNIRPVSYPPVYIQTGEMDNNVPPYHGKKFAARMQELNRSDEPVLLRVLAEGGHDRGQGEIFFRTIGEMQVFLEHYLDMEG